MTWIIDILKKLQFIKQTIYLTSRMGKVGIVGSGLIGRSWAMIFASAGFEVVLFDIQESQVKAALADIE